MDEDEDSAKQGRGKNRPPWPGGIGDAGPMRLLLLRPPPIERKPTNKQLFQELTCFLAASFGIASTPTLAAVLGQAWLAAGETEGSGLAFVEVDGEVSISSAEELRQAEGVADLIDSLGQKIHDAPFPIGQTLQSRSLLHTLHAYCKYLDTIKFKTPPKAYNRSNAYPRVLASFLAAGWSCLTDEEPDVWVDSYTEKGRGRFYELLCAACVSVNLACPSASSVRRWLIELDFKSPPQKGEP